MFGKKKSRGDKKKKFEFTKLFYATDVHGSERTFKKFVNAGKMYGVDVLVLGGDVTGKLLVPIIKDGDNSFHATVSGVRREIHSEEELENLKSMISDLGFYYEIMDIDRYNELKDKPEEVENIFKQKARERLIHWINLAEERLSDTNLKLFMTGGNDDDEWVVHVIEENQTGHIVNPEGRIVKVDDIHTMVSLGFSNPTPWNTPREVTEEKLSELIEETIKDIDDFSNVIFNFHAPPKDCTLDLAPMLDTSTDPPTPVVKAGQSVMIGVGSSAVREAIEKYQPLLALVGHIHESRGVVKIGRTTVVNPGSEYGEGILRGIIVNIQDNKVLSYQMTSG
ncbi:MAG: metallophosphoesterase [Spirochaetes bacterium]|nr:MAG: metallophosphoesterase [Spirochaetota bacterium]